MTCPPGPPDARVATAGRGDDNETAATTAFRAKTETVFPLCPDTNPMPASFAQMSRVPQHPRRLRDFRIAASLVIVLTLPAIASAKTPPPTVDIDAAQAAVLRAERADADQYAGDALQRARAALSAAQLALSARKNEDAVAQARLAAAEADYAHARSRETAQQEELAQRRTEIAELRRRLGMEAAP